MEDPDLITQKPFKTERRRSSIFSLLKRKKVVRQYSEPPHYSTLKLSRKFSVDSAILSDFKKEVNGYNTCLEKTPSVELSISQEELAGAASDSESEGMVDLERGPINTAEAALQRLRERYTEDLFRELGAAGELVEEVAEENKSLLWFLLKQVRPGMDLSKVVLPTFILEPRSFLDKLSDSYYHADILAQAALTADPYERFKVVVRWFMSGLYRKPKGLKKPYNPVLGETFRCYWSSNDSTDITYYVAEQVSHHPPVSAFYVSNRRNGFVIEGSLLARSKFYGNSTSAFLEGCARVQLLGWGETYVTTAPYAHCKGIVIGTLSMELGGKIQIICQQTGYSAEIEFKLRSFLSSSDSTNAIVGRIRKGRDVIATLDGYWDGRIDMKDKKTGEETNLLDVATLKEQRLTRYLPKMEYQHEYESQKLWIKVSEAIDKDDQVAATEQKTIIEEAQRERARNQVTPWMPRFFHKDEELHAPDGIPDQKWRYNFGNTTPWKPEEKFEYEEDFVITSITEVGEPAASAAAAPAPRAPRAPPAPTAPASDTDTHDETHRRSKANTTRTIKNSLQAVDLALRDQTAALERLAKMIERLSERRTATPYRSQNVGRLSPTTHGWDILVGFVLAVVLQAILNRLFFERV